MAVTVLLWAVGLALLYQFGVFAWNAVYWVRRRPESDSGEPTLSVLIPARNEIRNLPVLLAALQAQTLRPAEIIVCDDHSDDGMREWLQEHAAEFDVRWFQADPKPDEWVGKNWACHQLAQHATGDWFLFLDADIRPKPGFLEFIVNACRRTSAVLVTAFPSIDRAGVGDGLIIGMVPFSVCTMLPLNHVERTCNPAFAFANGQIMAFRREDYLRIEPHRQVRGLVLEDVGIARLIKRLRGRVHIADARHVVAARMYENTGQAIAGFSKNAVAITGGRLGAAVSLVSLTTTYLVPIWLAVAGYKAAWAVVGAGALLYGIPAYLSGLPAWFGLLYPAAIALAELVMIRSLIWNTRGCVRWKGRVYRRC